MSRALSAMSVLALATALTGCGSDTGTDSATAATQPASSTAPTDTMIGDAITFTRKGGGEIGSIRITDVVAVPDSCTIAPRGQVIAIRGEITNTGDIALPRFDTYDITVVDAGGFTQRVESTSVRLECDTTYPEIASSQVPGKTAGWAIFEVAQPNPSAVQYSPYVTDEGASLENMAFVETAPEAATVKVPSPLPVGPAPDVVEPTTAEPTPEPIPRTTVAQPAAPAEGQACDTSTDEWAVAADGQQLRCAYAGASTPRWVASVPYIGVREPGTPCELGEAVAESPAGVPMVCVGGPGTGEWQPGP